MSKSQAQIGKQRRVEEMIECRKHLIRHLQSSKLIEVDLDNYVLYAIQLFNITGTKVCDFDGLPSDLVKIAREQSYGLLQHKAQCEYVANLLLNIRDGLNSTRCESVPVQCPCCSGFTHLTKSHFTGRKGKWVYYCEPCNYSVRAYSGDKWPMGVPADIETRRERGKIKLAIDAVARSGNVSQRTVRLGMAKVLGLPIGCVAQEGSITSIEFVKLYRSALDQVAQKYQ